MRIAPRWLRRTIRDGTQEAQPQARRWRRAEPIPRQALMSPTNRARVAAFVAVLLALTCGGQFPTRSTPPGSEQTFDDSGLPPLDVQSTGQAPTLLPLDPPPMALLLTEAPVAVDRVSEESPDA